jgi:hypothetical protein
MNDNHGFPFNPVAIASLVTIIYHAHCADTKVSMYHSTAQIVQTCHDSVLQWSSDHSFRSFHPHWLCSSIIIHTECFWERDSAWQPRILTLEVILYWPFLSVDSWSSGWAAGGILLRDLCRLTMSPSANFKTLLFWGLLKKNYFLFLFLFFIFLFFLFFFLFGTKWTDVFICLLRLFQRIQYLYIMHNIIQFFFKCYCQFFLIVIGL